MLPQCRRRAPLRTDPHSLLRRKESTINVYRRAVGSFLQWCMLHRVSFSSAAELDDLLVEWKQSLVSKAMFANALSGIEIAIPWLKGTLTWSHQVLNDWMAVQQPIHHMPVSWPIAFLIAFGLAITSHPRLALGVLLQQSRGLRPSEMLELYRQDVHLPQESSLFDVPVCVLDLGARSGTKLGRARSRIIRPDVHPVALLAVQALCHQLQPGERLIQCSLQTYNARMQAVCRCLGLPAFTPHGLRAGFASDALLNGVPFVEIREDGGWLSDATLRIYLDAVSTATHHSSLALAQWASVIHQLRRGFPLNFPWWKGSCFQQVMPVPTEIERVFTRSHPTRTVRKY